MGKKKRSVNKSDAIREHVEKHPDDGPSAIADALGKQGIKVTAAFVSTVRSNDKRKSGPKNGRRGRKPKGGDLDSSTLQALVGAKKLVDAAGSVAAAKAALDNYGKLVD